MIPVAPLLEIRESYDVIGGKSIRTVIIFMKKL